MLYVDASTLLTQGMATIKRIVDQRLEELGLEKTELGRRLGYKNPYLGYYQLVSSDRVKLSDEKLERIAEALEWPRDHFKDPAKTIDREAYVRDIFEQFMKTDVARAADPETLSIIKSMKWLGKWLPSVKLYQAVVLAMEGRYTAAELAQSHMLEAADRAADVEVVRVLPEKIQAVRRRRSR
jgi:hypothetical protein